MTTEQIERLMMDLACGQMNEDTQMLFKAYLDEHPELQSAADDIERLCARCEGAMGAEPSVSTPRPPRARPAWPRSLVRYAALILLAAGLGLMVGRSRPAPTPPAQAVPAAFDIKIPAASGLTRSRFWQEKAQALRSPRPWTPSNSSKENETFWHRYRKEWNYVQMPIQ